MDNNGQEKGNPLDSVRLYKSVLEASPDVITITDLEGRIKFASPRAVEMFRLDSAQDLVGRPLFDFIDPADIPKVDNSLGEMFRGIFSGAEEFRGRRADGTGFDIEVNGEFVRDEKGRPLEMIFITRDITSRKQIERKLAATEELFRRMVENINEVIYELALGGTIRYASPALRKMLGYEPEEVVGKNLLDFIFPEDKKMLQEALVKLGTEDYFHLEYRYYNKAGELRWVSSSMAPIIENGVMTGGRGTLSDIHDRKMAQLKLLESNRKINVLMNNLRGVAYRCSTDPSRSMDFISNGIFELTGYPPEDFIGSRTRDYLSIIHPDDREMVWNVILEHILRQEHYAVEYRVITSDGSQKWVWERGRGIFRKDTAEALEGFILDVSDRKKAEEESLLFRTISDQANYGNALTDLNGNLLYANKAFAGMHGYEAGEISGKPISILHNETQMERVNVLIETLRRTGGFSAEEVWRTRKDGSVFPSLMNAKVILDSNGRPRFLSASAIDISEQKEQEEQIRIQNARLSTILDAIPDMIFITDRDGSYLEYYKSKSNTQLNDYDYLVGQNIRDAFDPETAEALLCRIRECLDTGKIITYEYPRLEQGVIKTFEGRIVRLEEDKVLRFVRDVTLRKKAEQDILDLNANLERKVQERTEQLENSNKELHKARIEADKANTSKSEFLSRMSHELRTPLNSILGFAQLLEMEQLTPKQKKEVGHIMHSGKHLLDLINEILDISRIESGRLSLSMEPVHVNSLVSEIFDILHPLAGSREVSLLFDQNQSEGTFVKADKQRLKQVLLNLAGNAVKYNHQGGSVKVMAETGKKESGGTGRVRIRVSDTGPGISETDIQRIFTPFERIGADQTNVEGTGLGLTVARKLTEAMGGRIEVESVMGEGSVFWIELPQAESPVDVVEKQKFQFSAASPLDQVRGTILYVEDNIPNIELVEQILSDCMPGIRMLTDITGAKAVSMALEHAPDLILLDLNLPQVHGREVLRNLKAEQRTKEIPVVVISADALPQQLIELFKSGASNYLTKPLDVNDFLRVISQYLLG